MKPDPTTWFTALFGIDLPQYQLPFVDFNVLSDVPLYIDPYAINKDPSELAALCNNAIVSYFQTLLEAIRAEARTACGTMLSATWPNRSRFT